MLTLSKRSKIDILVAEKSGFCFGVRRAYDLALSAAEVPDGPLYSWGPLIHNPQVVILLEGRGLKVISDSGQVCQGDRVVVRSHGISPLILAELKTRGAQIIDATCPLVKKAQGRISQLEREGYQILLLGNHTHAEVQALMGYAAPSRIRVINCLTDLGSLVLEKRVGVVSQTTQGEAFLREVVGALASRVDELKVFNTLCHFMAARLAAAMNLAKEVDLLLVVGGQESANTGRMRDACLKILPATYQIEGPDEVDPDWLRGKSRVGVTAGASTPEWVIYAVVGRLRELSL